MSTPERQDDPGEYGYGGVAGSDSRDTDETEHRDDEPAAEPLQDREDEADERRR